MKKIMGFILPFLTTICLLSQVTQADTNPEYLSLEVGIVRVTPTRPGTTQNWVIPGKASTKDSCAFFSTLAKGAGLATGGVSSLIAGPMINSMFCQPPAVLGSAKSETDPNIYVRISSNRLFFRSYTVARTRSQSFKFKVIVPTSTIPRAGLVLDVVNDDGSGDEESQEIIGQIRLSNAELIMASNKGTPIIKKDNGVEKIEIIVSPEVPSERKRSLTMDVQKRLFSVDDFPIYAGEVVEVSSSGSYRVSDYSAVVTPMGYNGKGKVYPDPPFNSANLGAALVRLGKKGLMKGFLVKPCVGFISPFEGNIAVGINNDTPEAARGDLKFDVLVRTATPEEWKKEIVDKKCSVDAVDIANKATLIDYEPFSKKVAGILKEFKNDLAVAIISHLHPTGKNAKLKSVDSKVTETGIEVVIESTWNGGFLGDAYVTTVKWELNAERHINASLVQDSAKIRASDKAKKNLNEYFVSNIDPLVRK